MTQKVYRNLVHFFINKVIIALVFYFSKIMLNYSTMRYKVPVFYIPLHQKNKKTT